MGNDIPSPTAKPHWVASSNPSPTVEKMNSSKESTDRPHPGRQPNRTHVPRPGSGFAVGDGISFPTMPRRPSPCAAASLLKMASQQLLSETLRRSTHNGQSRSRRQVRSSFSRQTSAGAGQMGHRAAEAERRSERSALYAQRSALRSAGDIAHERSVK